MRRSRKDKRTRRKRAQRGGNVGQGYTFGPALLPGVDTGPGAVPYSSCMAVPRPGMVEGIAATGLPGMSGGRRGRGSRKGRRGSRATRKGSRQQGGRYGFDLTQPLGGTPFTGGIPQVVKIPCESSSTTANRLNQHGGVGGVDSAFYSAPTAGYTNTASTWTGSTGAPVLLQTPYDARTMNPACLKTGGGRGSRKGSRKSRKGLRKGRKGSRKSRK